MASKTGIRSEVLNTTEQFGAMREEWTSLLELSGSNVIFLTWNWLWKWWSSYATEKESLCIIKVYDNEELIGIAPFYKVTKKWRNLFSYRRMLFIGSNEQSLISEYIDIISKKNKEELVVQTVIETVVDEDLCDDLLLHKIDTSSKSVTFLNKSACNLDLLYSKGRDFESPYIKLPRTHEEYMQQLSPSTRAKIRRDLRRLKSKHNVSFRRTKNRDELDNDFDQFVRLHKIRWNSRNCPGSFETGKFKGFLKSVAEKLLDTGSLDLLFLEISGRPVAALFNMRYNNKIYFLQSGLDTEATPSLSPGLVLHDNSIHEAIDAGVDEYDFLMMGATDMYKKKLAKRSRFLCDIYLARPGLLNSLKRFEVKAKQFVNFLRKRNSGTTRPN